MLARVCLLVCALAATVPTLDAGLIFGADHIEKAFFTWSAEKALGGCLGEENYKMMSEEVGNLMGECFGEVYAAKAAAQPEADHTEPETSTAGQRSRPFFNAEKVMHLTNDLQTKIQIVDCYFGKLNLNVNENGSVDASYFKEMNEGLTIDEPVKSYVLEGIDNCAASAHQSQSYYGQQFEDFEKKLWFYRCAHKNYFESCIRQDLEQHSSEYDLSKMGSFLQDLPGVSKQWIIFSSFANWDSTGLWDSTAN